jgi:hypothetical protein
LGWGTSNQYKGKANLAASNDDAVVLWLGMEGCKMTKDEALDLALEALESFDGVGDVVTWEKQWKLCFEAITAIKQARALDKKAENARELGLDYEPAQQEPVAHAVIAGALFDFMGWLTSRKERLVLSSADNASPAVEAITEFAKMRGLSLNDAKVQDWNTSPSAQRKESK